MGLTALGYTFAKASADALLWRDKTAGRVAKSFFCGGARLGAELPS
jgi:hypothetical protein